jgi:transglutaminase-like putative cysteine protease
MHYKITHSTRYTYTESVPVCHNLVHLAPRDGRLQHCEQHRLLIHPTPVSRARRLDYFGNQVDYFSIQEAHRGLTVTATSRIRVTPPETVNPADTPPWEAVVAELKQNRSARGLDALQYCFNSPNIRVSPKLAEYAQQSFTEKRPILEAALDLNRRIHADFTYDPKATTVTSRVEQVLQGRRGVCQDFAHLAISCLRSLGLAARYVSGYLETKPPPGKPKLIGADASHAWVSLFVPDAGWVDLDPTNNLIPGESHITVAWGRDYGDVTPVKGVVMGGGAHTLSVKVDVKALD